MRGVAALLVVEDLDPFKDPLRELGAAVPDATVEQLGLQRREEALGDRVVERVADGPDRPQKAGVT